LIAAEATLSTESAPTFAAAESARAALSALTTETTLAFAAKTAWAALTTMTAFALAAASHSLSHRLESCRQFLQVQRAIAIPVVMLDHHRGDLTWLRPAAFALAAAESAFALATFASALTLSATTFAFSLAKLTLGQCDRRHGGNRSSRGATGEQFAKKIAATLVNALKRRIHRFWKLVCHHKTP